MKHLTFDVGTNFDKNLINVIAENNKNNQFSSVFGKLKTDFLGGGRSSAFLPDITMEELRDYIELCHKNKLEFNYLINAMCMENKELEADSHFKIIELLKELDKIGVDANHNNIALFMRTDKNTISTFQSYSWFICVCIRFEPY